MGGYERKGWTIVKLTLIYLICKIRADELQDKGRCIASVTS